MFILFFLLSVAAFILIPVALIKPSFATANKIPSRLKAVITYFGLMILFFTLSAMTVPETPKTQVAGEKSESIIEAKTFEEEKGENSLIQEIIETTPAPTATPIPSPSPTIKPTSKPTAIPTVKPTTTPTKTPAPKVETYSEPAGATAICRDGTYSYSASRRGTCSHHGGVAKWL